MAVDSYHPFELDLIQLDDPFKRLPRGVKLLISALAAAYAQQQDCMLAVKD